MFTFRSRSMFPLFDSNSQPMTSNVARIVFPVKVSDSPSRLMKFLTELPAVNAMKQF